MSCNCTDLYIPTINIDSICVIDPNEFRVVVTVNYPIPQGDCGPHEDPKYPNEVKQLFEVKIKRNGTNETQVNDIENVSDLTTVLGKSSTYTVKVINLTDFIATDNVIVEASYQADNSVFGGASGNCVKHLNQLVMDSENFGNFGGLSDCD